MTAWRVFVAALVAGIAVLIVAFPPARGSAAADKDCSDFPNQAAAQAFFDSNGGSASNNLDDLDADHDGIACESLPCPCAGPGPASSPAPAPQQPAQKRRPHALVLRAVDGDTLYVTLQPSGDDRYVRLLGIDTPETVRPGTPVQCGGPQASASMHQLADGREVTLITDPTQDRVDRYGRLLAYAIRGGVDLDKVQLARGWADVYVYEHHPFEKVRSFRRAQGRAESGDRGVWADCKGNFHTPG